MPVHITYFVHGTTADNEQNISSGWSDCALSELGLRRAHELRDAIKERTFDIVFCSDLKRAVQSAHIVFDGRLPIVFDPRLRECNYGIYNGQSSDIVEPLQEAHTTQPFPEGESYEDVKARLAAFLADIKRDYSDKRVAIMAHKAPQLALDVLLENKTWQQAFAEDWRKSKAWQPGWEYTLE